ncbi:MAG: helix-turn-helix domain-containing protein, partial [Alphaproteobacteria bacterium]|nr:helix-turn-helix domain-containing protein [Alphaproteobacteria bacterium]
HDGRFDVDIPGLHLIRYSKTNETSNRVMSQPGLCVVAQGAKRVMLGHDVYEYDKSSMAAYAAEVPIASNVVRASEAEPYLCLVLDLDPRRIAELALKVFPHGLPKTQAAKAIYIEQSDAKIVSAATRLLELLPQPDDGELLAPLLTDEILIRLLRSPAGAQIAQIGVSDSSMHKISRAISWLRDNYAEPMKVGNLAEIANMSESSFHQHFKAVMAMSPLQFQKTLRLQEARNLMLSKMMDVSSASLQVGYASVSQFSREYSRFFGSSPSRDIAELRESA